MGGEKVWKNVIAAKYGDNELGKVDLGIMSGGIPYSVWWKDLCHLGRGVGLAK
jgi:hypothetical protein